MKGQELDNALAGDWDRWDAASGVLREGIG